MSDNRLIAWVAINFEGTNEGINRKPVSNKLIKSRAYISHVTNDR